MNCIKCGAKNKDIAVFCGKCGERMDTKSDAASKAVDTIPMQSKKGLFIGITAAVVVIASAAILLFVFADPGKAVNFNGGIAIESTFSGDGGWIYYCNSADGYSLYTISTHSYKKTKLNSEASDSINLSAGWVYYRVFSENGENLICRMRKNGTSREVIKEDVNAFHLLLFDKWLFYTAASPESPNDGRYLYRISTDGAEEKRFDLQPLGDAFGIMGGWIYYIDSKDSSCYKMKADGTGKRKLKEDCSCLALSYDGIYFNDDGCLSKMSTDGKELKKLTDDHARNIIVTPEWVYYINLSDSESVYKVRTDGTERTKLNGDPTLLFSIAENWGDRAVERWIYYVNKNEGDYIYRMKTDGFENEKLK